MNPIPYKFEVERGHSVSVAEDHGVISYLDVTSDSAHLYLQPPESMHGRANLPNFEISLFFNGPRTGADLAYQLSSTLASRVGHLSSIVAEQTAGGQYRRAAPYSSLVADAIAVRGSWGRSSSLAWERVAGTKPRALQAEVVRELESNGRPPARAWGVSQLLHLVALLGLDLSWVLPRAAAEPAAVPFRAVASATVGMPSLRWDASWGCDVRISEKHIVAAAPRESRYDVLAIGFTGANKPLARAASLLIRVSRLLGEAEAHHLARVSRAVEVAAAVAPELVGTGGEDATSVALQEWSGWINRAASAGHLWFATSTACIPLPVPGRSWRWAMWSNHKELKLVSLDGARVGVPTLEDAPGVSAPSRGSGLRQNDAALAEVLEVTERLEALFSVGAKCPPDGAQRWLKAARALIAKEWWDVLRATSPTWVSWVEAGGGSLRR